MLASTLLRATIRTFGKQDMNTLRPEFIYRRALEHKSPVGVKFTRYARKSRTKTNLKLQLHSVQGMIVCGISNAIFFFK